MNERWTSVERLLCIRLDGMGDLLMTTPAIRALKESLPDAAITALVSSAGAEAACYVPEISRVLTYEAAWMKSTPPRPEGNVDRAMVDLLKEFRFDAAVIFTVFSQSPLPAALMCFMADIPLRLAHCHENPYQLLSDWVKDPEPEGKIRHEVRRHLDLVATIGAYTGDDSLSLRVPADAKAAVESFLGRNGLDIHRPWVLIHPGASAPSRRYPPEGYAQVAGWLAASGYQVVFSGTAEERSLIEFIRSQITAPTWSFAGMLDFPSLCALIAAAPLLIVNNTGPAHIAASLGTPVVELYALTNPQHAVWKVRSHVLFQDVPCRFCYKSICPEQHQNCLCLVQPHRIVEAALDLLKG